jgi:hypothetical protein
VPSSRPTASRISSCSPGAKGRLSRWSATSSISSVPRGHCRVRAWGPSVVWRDGRPTRFFHGLAAGSMGREVTGRKSLRCREGSSARSLDGPLVSADLPCARRITWWEPLRSGRLAKASMCATSFWNSRAGSLNQSVDQMRYSCHPRRSRTSWRSRSRSRTDFARW